MYLIRCKVSQIKVYLLPVCQIKNMNFNSSVIKLLIAPVAALLFFSCATPTNITYFQDVADGGVDTVSTAQSIRIRPGDKISIIVNSRDPQISNLFNLAYATRYVGDVNNGLASSQSTGVQGYAVAEDGTIDFPVIGAFRVGGLTREEIARSLKNELMDRNLVKDPVITVEYLNLKVSVLGEVSHPGRIAIDRDEFTILDAISAAGDLTIYGVRENVRVIRAEDGIRRTYVVNLLSSKDLLSSPVYYLQQNDIIYVDPNDMRVRQSTVNGNNVRNTSFWISLASLATTITTAVFTIIR